MAEMLHVFGLRSC